MFMSSCSDSYDRIVPACNAAQPEDPLESSTYFHLGPLNDIMHWQRLCIKIFKFFDQHHSKIVPQFVNAVFLQIDSIVNKILVYEICKNNCIPTVLVLELY